MVRDRTYRLVLFTNRKPHSGFQLVPKSVTLSDLEWLSSRHLHYWHEVAAFGANYVKFSEARPMLSVSDRYVAHEVLVFGNIWFMGDHACYLCSS